MLQNSENADYKTLYSTGLGMEATAARLQKHSLIIQTPKSNSDYTKGVRSRNRPTKPEVSQSKLASVVMLISGSIGALSIGLLSAQTP